MKTKEKVKVRVYAEYYKDYEFDKEDLTTNQIFKKAEEMFLLEDKRKLKGLKYSDRGVSSVSIEFEKKD